MEIFTWIVVGILTGVAASIVARGTQYSMLGDCIVGAIGAIIGGAAFAALNLTLFHGTIGTISIALIGAVLVLFGVRVFERMTRKPTRRDLRLRRR